MFYIQKIGQDAEFFSANDGAEEILAQMADYARSAILSGLSVVAGWLDPSDISAFEATGYLPPGEDVRRTPGLMEFLTPNRD